MTQIGLNTVPYHIPPYHTSPHHTIPYYSNPYQIAILVWDIFTQLFEHVIGYRRHAAQKGTLDRIKAIKSSAPIINNMFLDNIHARQIPTLGEIMLDYILEEEN